MDTISNLHWQHTSIIGRISDELQQVNDLIRSSDLLRQQTRYNNAALTYMGFAGTPEWPDTDELSDVARHIVSDYVGRFLIVDVKHHSGTADEHNDWTVETMRAIGDDGLVIISATYDDPDVFDIRVSLGNVVHVESVILPRLYAVLRYLVKTTADWHSDDCACYYEGAH